MKKANWSIFLVNGLIAILFGLLALLVNDEIVKKLITSFGLLIILAGLIMFIIAYRNLRAKKPYMLLMTEAILAVIVGAVISIYSTSTMMILCYIIGIWAVIIGLWQIIIAVRMKVKVSYHGMFTLNGVVTLVFGLLLLYNPEGTIKVLFSVIGVLAIIAGLFLVFLSVKIKGIAES